MNGFFVLVFAATIFAAPLMIGRARAYDRFLNEPAPESDECAEILAQRVDDDADAFRKGES
ncbi:hypothetical protein [Arthrobacter sp. NA-172]|uniref:hypothetical protein n=1 Tax=Arthrobacter sp. NA-172 TaxID=3367524 RepID=UPI003754E508